MAERAVKPITLYRLITGVQGLSFNRKISLALNEGWKLYGNPTLTIDPETGETHCCQAILRATRNPADYDKQVLIDGVAPASLK